MHFKIEKKLNNFILEVNLDSYDLHEINSLISTTKKSLEFIETTVVDKLLKINEKIKEPSFYGVPYREYRKNKEDMVMPIGVILQKMVDSYFNLYFFNKRNIRNDFFIINNLDQSIDAFVNNDKNEISNLNTILNTAKAIQEIFNNYLIKLNSFKDNINSSLNNPFSLKIVKKTEKDFFNVNNIDFIFFKESDKNLEKEWIVSHVMKEINQIKGLMETFLDIKENGSIESILNQIIKSEKFLKEAKEKNPFFLILKESTVLKKYLHNKDKILSKIYNCNYNENLNSSLKKIEEKANGKLKASVKAVLVFFNEKKKDNEFYKIIGNKMFSFSKDGLISHFLVENQNSNQELILLNKELSEQKGFMSNIKYDSYYTVLKIDGEYSILKINEYKFYNKNLIKKYFL